MLQEICQRVKPAGRRRDLPNPAPVTTQGQSKPTNFKTELTVDWRDHMDDKNLEDEVSKFLAGFKMIYCGLVGTMEKYGVKAIDGVNKPFDPVYHQAVMTEKREGVEPGMVIEVLQKGYLLKDKVIRPAMVRVSE